MGCVLHMAEQHPDSEKHHPAAGGLQGKIFQKGLDEKKGGKTNITSRGERQL